jgi:phospholipase/carboxylesterase
VLELAKQQAPVAGRLIAFGSRFVNLPEVPVSLDQTLHLFHAASDAEVDAKHSHIAQMAIDNLEGDCTIDLVQGIDDSLDPALITQMRVRLETCIPLRILREVQEAAGK